MSELLRRAAEANRAYREGEFATAAEGYRALMDGGARSGDLYFNLGSALYQDGRPGEAAWAWERALRMEPGDEAALSQLERVRGELGVGAEPLPFAHRLGARLDGNLCSLLLLVAWIAFCGLLLLRRRIGPRVASLAAAIALLGALLGGTGLYLVEAERRAGWAVVIRSVEARLAPHEEAESLSSLKEASRVRIARREGDWALLRLGESARGWVPGSAVAEIGEGGSPKP